MTVDVVGGWLSGEVFKGVLAGVCAGPLEEEIVGLGGYLQLSVGKSANRERGT